MEEFCRRIAGQLSWKWQSATMTDLVWLGLAIIAIGCVILLYQSPRYR